jgi:predicted ATPase
LDALAAARELLSPGRGREPDATPLAIALHTGDLADPPAGSQSEAPSACRYHGPLLDRAERLLLAAHPGQILASETTARLLDGDGLAIHDLGIFRPRSGIAPERWFEIADPGTPTRFPPPKAERALSGHLPLQLTRFIGRESELAELTIRLRNPADRLVTLVGPGGTGKTRLALEAASRAASDVPALWFVPLADLTDPEHIPGAVLEVLQRPIERSSDPLSALAHALEGTETWLILDNLEHLLPRGAAIVAELLARVPQLRLIVTSRRPLGIAGEWRFSVPPLATPEGPATPAELVALESVQLFVDRAQAVRPDFQVSESNARTLAQLCSRLDGLPLAIELAAARALVLGPAKMLRRLDRRLDFLATRGPDVPSRHRTLRATLEWSYRLLAPDVQRFFAQLAVFRGPMTLTAVEAVSEDPVALDHLIELRECSLILGQEVGNEMRFRLLDTIREFAAEKLPESARAELEHRHAEHYVALAERARLGVNSAQESTWLDQIALDHDQLRAVLDRCAAGTEDVQLGLRLTAAIASFWSFRGHFREGRQRIAELLVLPAAAERNALRAQALLESGNLALQQSATAEGIPALEESLAIFRELGDEAGIGRALNHLAISAYYRGDYAAANRLYQEGLDICHHLGDRRAVSQALTNLGNVANAIGDYSVARARYEESLAIKREFGIPRDIATALMGLGNVAENEGDLAASLAYHVECLSLCRQSGDRQRTAWTLVNLGNVTFKLGDMGRARGYYVESLAIAADLGDRFNLSGCLDGLSTFAFAAGEPVGAARLFSAAMTFRQAARGGVPPREQEAHEYFLGELRSALGEPALAHALAEGAALAGGELSPEALAGLLASAGIS